MSWTQISPRIFRWTDTCNVYCVTSGDRGILIDAGSGAVVDRLEEIGVRQIEWVLHTHHHRDQSWGTGRLREHGAKVAVPEHERHLFDQAELFWQHKRVYDNYNDRNTFFALAENVPVDADLEDYETFTWRDVELEIIPAKGHTHGSSMLIGSIDGRSVAFTGDLLAAGGVLYQYHALEYNYGDQQGAFFTLQSLQALRRHAPDLALPSHGDLIEDPVGDCARLEDRLMTLARLGAGIRFMGRDGGHGLDILPDPRFTQVSRHLLWGGPHTCSNFYVLLSESGKACFIDYGHSHWAHMGTGSEREDGDTMRFVVHHLDELRETYGVHDIDLVLVTHIHDDHTAGIPYLVRHESARVWALDEVAQVLEDPAGWCSTPCTLAPPIPIERQLTDGERFTWEEFDFEVHHAPGQTEFHSVLATHVDGQKVAFTGDNVFLELAPGITGEMTTQLFQTTVLRNSLQLWMHRRCADVMDLVEPDLVCPGHRELIPWDSRRALEYRDFIDRKERVVRDLLDDPADEGVDLWWARLIPYLRSVEPGQTCTYRLLLRNNAERPVRLEARLLVPAGWQTTDAFQPLDLEAGARGELTLTATAPPHPDIRRILTAEIRINGQTRGPIAEALVTVTVAAPATLVVAHLDSTPILESIRRLPLSTRKSNRVLGKSPSRRTALNPSPGGEVRVRGLPLEIVTYAKPLCHTPTVHTKRPHPTSSTWHEAFESDRPTPNSCSGGSFAAARWASSFVASTPCSPMCSTSTAMNYVSRSRSMATGTTPLLDARTTCDAPRPLRLRESRSCGSQTSKSFRKPEPSPRPSGEPAGNAASALHQPPPTSPPS